MAAASVSSGTAYATMSLATAGRSEASIGTHPTTWTSQRFKTRSEYFGSKGDWGFASCRTKACTGAADPVGIGWTRYCRRPGDASSFGEGALRGKAASNAIELATSLTQRQRQALDVVAKAERPLRNKDFRERFAPDGRRTTGWAKALGPCTKPRDHDPASLWAGGLVTVVDNFTYTITALGRAVVNATGSRAIHAKVECERSCASLSHSVDPATALRTSEERRQPMPPAERPQSEFALPRPRVCGPPGADGSQRIPFLKDFADRHDLRYEPKLFGRWPARSLRLHSRYGLPIRICPVVERPGAACSSGLA